jgi:hypothetical protein
MKGVGAEGDEELGKRESRRKVYKGKVEWSYKYAVMR